MTPIRKTGLIGLSWSQRRALFRNDSADESNETGETKFRRGLKRVSGVCVCIGSDELRKYELLPCVYVLNCWSHWSHPLSLSNSAGKTGESLRPTLRPVETSETSL